jgi:hypothetical protein
VIQQSDGTSKIMRTYRMTDGPVTTGGQLARSRRRR